MGKSYVPQSTSLRSSPNSHPSTTPCSSPTQWVPQRRTTQTAKGAIEPSACSLLSQEGDPEIYLSSCHLSHSVPCLFVVSFTRPLQQPPKALFSSAHRKCLIQTSCLPSREAQCEKELVLGCQGTDMGYTSWR